MVPMNLLPRGAGADYVLTGSWARKAMADAGRLGTVRAAWDGGGSGYTTLPDPAGIEAPADSAYLHLTSNETIGGVQWKDFPAAGPVPLAADMSSDILSRRIPVERFGLIYAGAQKNLGPAGLTVVIISDELIGRCPEPSLPT
jgi:phosphoserine aminotransferase